MHVQKQEVLSLLTKLNLSCKVYEHHAAKTMCDLEAVDRMIDGCYCKNLFLRNANGKQHYLVIVNGDKPVDLKKLAKVIGSTRLSFASDERLLKWLQLQPGSVGPFGLIHDTTHHVITIIDREIVDAEKICFHPNDNTATIVISYSGLDRYFRHINARTEVYTLPCMQHCSQNVQK